MPDLWDDGPEPGAFALPTDAERYGAETAVVESPADTPQEATEPAETAEQTADRLRDEKGRFAAQTEPEVEAETPAEESLILGKFKSQEDLIRSYQELERQRGLDSTEKAELRRIAEQFEALQGQVAGLPEQLAPRQQYDYDSLIETDPATAAQLAYEQGDRYRLQQAVSAWNDIAPGVPAVWAEGKQAQEAMRAEVDQLKQQFAPMTEASKMAAARAALVEFGQTHPDLEQYQEAMMRVAEDAPELRPLIESDDYAARVRVLDYLYTKAKAQQAHGDADNLTSALRAAAQDTARAEEDAAVVTTAQQTVPATKPTEAQRIGAEWEKFTAPLDAGWQIS